ncbi:50S ribosomal protein L9 [bioreactor metagenome]|uniref:50S ribosomal protein L9 n=1 Tax=bioreactor metagenome TaxID=1076179 RepID=A0A644YNW7_9ZZZZ|nr:50S ribosomal protein L9 [Erysipelotrichaceae bacterium]
MKVILLADVKNVGKKGEIVTVADGYGRNFLLRNRLAVIASDKGLEVLQEQKQHDLDELKDREVKAKELQAKLKDVTLDFTVTSGAEGKLFGSVSTKQVVQELQKKHGIAIDKKKIIDGGPFNEAGVHIIKVELFKNVIGELKINIRSK